MPAWSKDIQKHVDDVFGKGRDLETGSAAESAADAVNAAFDAAPLEGQMQGAATTAGLFDGLF